MVSHAFIIATVFIVLLLPTSAATGATRLTCKSAQATLHAARPGAAAVQIRSDSRVWLEVDEDGRALILEGVADSNILPSPPRLARHGAWIEAGVKRIVVFDKAVRDKPVSFKARLFCETGTVRARDFERLATVAARMAPGGRNEQSLTGILQDLRAFESEISDPELRTYAAHLASQAQLAPGHSLAAAEAFKHVEQAWHAINDHARALAARAAWAEEEYSLGYFDAAIAAATSMPSNESIGARGYYASRLINNRCVALTRRGRRTDAVDCYAGLVKRWTRLNEPLELANALLNQGGQQRDVGDLHAASGSADEAEKLMALPEIHNMPVADVAMIAGRMHLLRADLSLLRGEASTAVASYDKALSDFEMANAPRWRANVLVQLAMLFGRLGAYGDAYASWTGAIRLLGPAESPARISNALFVLAQIERDNAHPALSAWLAELARTRFAALGDLDKRDAAQFARLRALVDAGNAETAAHEIEGESREARRPESVARSLAIAAIALALQRPGNAAQVLANIRGTLSLGERIDLDTLSAKASRAQRDPLAASMRIGAALNLLGDAASRSTNPLMRILLERRSEALRDLALRWRIDDGIDDGVIDDVLRWTTAERPLLPPVAVGMRSMAPANEHDMFDNALARELLLSQADGGAVIRALSAALGASKIAAGVKPPVRVTLRSIQTRLQDSDAFLVLLQGEARGMAAWITHDAVRLSTTASPQVVQACIDALEMDVRSPDRPLARISHDARALTDALWQDGQIPPAAQRLYVLSNRLTEAIPWALLPGRNGEPLMETTNVTLVQLTERSEPPTFPRPAKLRIAIAPQLDAPSGLELLPGADAEQSLIAGAAPRWHIEILDASRGPIKRRMLAAIAEPGALVHVAAHGMTQSGYLGRSGLWLDAPRASATPEFVSVLDLFDAGANADLVVLNACSSAASDDETLAFADALVRLGTRHVIAARWQVSDGAAAIWVPAFYGALASESPDPAMALRRAQQRLVESRAYRHPFYWASLVHMEPFGIGPEPDRISQR